MKYPQLVSSIAIREISDWLIKRLEELDIDNPVVYARLLLSLLHTPLKVNAIDIVEVSRNLYHINRLQCYCTHFHICISAFVLRDYVLFLLSLIFCSARFVNQGKVAFVVISFNFYQQKKYFLVADKEYSEIVNDSLKFLSAKLLR